MTSGQVQIIYAAECTEHQQIKSCVFNLRNNKRTSPSPYGRMGLLGKGMLGAFSSKEESNDQQLRSEMNTSTGNKENIMFAGNVYLNDLHQGSER